MGSLRWGPAVTHHPSRVQARHRVRRQPETSRHRAMSDSEVEAAREPEARSPPPRGPGGAANPRAAQLGRPGARLACSGRVPSQFRSRWQQNQGGDIRAVCLQMLLAQGRSEGPARPRAGLGLQVHGQQVPPSKPCQTQQAHRSYSAGERRENAI